MKFIYDKSKNKFILIINNQSKYEFENFVENINQFIVGVYLICFQNENKSKFKLVNVTEEYEVIINKLDNKFINLNIEKINFDINIEISNLIMKIQEVIVEYYRIHSIDTDRQFEYDKYQKLKKYRF